MRTLWGSCRHDVRTHAHSSRVSLEPAQMLRTIVFLFCCTILCRVIFGIELPQPYMATVPSHRAITTSQTFLCRAHGRQRGRRPRDRAEGKYLIWLISRTMNVFMHIVSLHSMLHSGSAPVQQSLLAAGEPCVVSICPGMVGPSHT